MQPVRMSCGSEPGHFARHHRLSSCSHLLVSLMTSRILLCLSQAKLRYKKVRSSLTSGSDSSAPVSADSTPFSSPTKLTPADSALTSVGQGNASSPRRLNRVPSIQTALGATASLIAETASSGDNLPEKEDERVAEEGGEQRQRRLSAQRSEERKMQAAVEKAEEIVARELEKERASAERRDASRAKFLDLERREREQAEVKSQRQRAQQRIDELKARAEDATKRAEMAWKMREARTASDSFCAIFPDKDKVLLPNLPHLPPSLSPVLPLRPQHQPILPGCL